MARSRNIKPGFFMNDELAEIEPLGRLLFAGLWCIADREGRLEDRPRRIKAEVMPYDNCDINGLLDQLAGRGFITRYKVDGERYIQVVNFAKHQNPHYKEVPSEIPAPEGHTDSEYKSPPPTEAERQAIFKRDGFKCVICGATDDLTLDHVIPRSKGGTSESGNLQTLCRSCNTSKGNRLDFMSAQQEGNDGLSLIQPRTELESNSVRDGTLIPDSFNLIPDSLNMIEEGPENPDAPSAPLSKVERECLKIIKEVPNYHFDYTKDIDHLRSLVIDFPNVNILNELKKWRTYKLDHPLKKNSNARLQIRNWIENADKWNKDERASPEPDKTKFEGIYLT